MVTFVVCPPVKVIDLFIGFACPAKVKRHSTGVALCQFCPLSHLSQSYNFSLWSAYSCKGQQSHDATVAQCQLCLRFWLSTGVVILANWVTLCPQRSRDTTQMPFYVHIHFTYHFIQLLLFVNLAKWFPRRSIDVHAPMLVYGNFPFPFYRSGVINGHFGQFVPTKVSRHTTRMLLFVHCPSYST